MKYNLHANAENFNLSFLGLDPNIKTAEGILNMDMTLTNAATSGKIDLANFSYITKDGLTNAQNINAKIDVANYKLIVLMVDLMVEHSLSTEIWIYQQFLVIL